MNKNLFTIKNLIRALSVLLIIFFFVPSFMVSCAGENIKFSAAKAMVGIRYKGDRVSDPSIICVLLLLLPIAMLVIWCLKNAVKDKIAAIVCMACAAADLIMWIVVRIGVAANADEVYGTSKILAGFVFNIIFILIVIAANILIMLNIVPADKPLIGTADGMQPMQQPNIQQNLYQSAPWQNTYQSSPVSEAPVQSAAETEEPVQEEAAPAVCANCGAALSADTKFCTKCGTKIE